MDDATRRFQLALPFTLLPIAPSLSSLHASRVHSTLYCCLRCGCALHRGDSSVRSVRVKRPRNTKNDRVMQTTCLICGWIQNTPRIEGNATIFPSRKSSARTSSPPKLANPIPEPQRTQSVETPIPPLSSSSSIANPALQAQKSSIDTKAGTMLPGRSRSKKKAGLEFLLERNKQREKQEKRKDNTLGSGLAMLLDTL